VPDMTYNVFGGTLHLAQSIMLTLSLYQGYVFLRKLRKSFSKRYFFGTRNRWHHWCVLQLLWCWQVGVPQDGQVW